MPLLSEPMLLRQYERIGRCRSLDKIIIATSTDRTDDPIARLCEENRIACFRGSLDDVLDRYHRAAERYACNHIVRLTGDCPLCDPQVIDDVVDFYLKGGFDIASNTVTPSFPDGCDAEVFGFETLERAARDAQLPSQREHVTPYMYDSGRFRIGDYRADVDESALRWTVDEPEDFAFVTRVYEALYPNDPAFASADIMALLTQRPELARLNDRFQRNEGYKASLARDPSDAV